MIPAVIELRQYTLQPSRREDLITLFEREFVDSQEAEGIRLIGLFRDLDNPDRFVWLRGFPDMEARRASLGRFYGGPVWAAHSNAANETMIDSDDVLLLKPIAPSEGVAEQGGREPIGGIIVCGLHAAAGPVQADALRSAVTASGLTPLAVLSTEPAENTFPRLPVRAGGPFVVWFASAANEQAADAALALLVSDDDLGPQVLRLRLTPTLRSRLQA